MNNVTIRRLAAATPTSTSPSTAPATSPRTRPAPSAPTATTPRPAAAAGAAALGATRSWEPPATRTGPVTRPRVPKPTPSAPSPAAPDANAPTSSGSRIELPRGTTRTETIAETRELLDDILADAGAELRVNADGGVTATRADGSHLTIPGLSVGQRDQSRPQVRASVGITPSADGNPDYRIDLVIPASEHASAVTERSFVPRAVRPRIPGGTLPPVNRHPSNSAVAPGGTAAHELVAAGRTVLPLIRDTTLDASGHVIASVQANRRDPQTLAVQPTFIQPGTYSLPDGGVLIADPSGGPGSRLESAVASGSQMLLLHPNGISQWVVVLDAQEVAALRAAGTDPYSIPGIHRPSVPPGASAD